MIKGEKMKGFVFSTEWYNMDAIYKVTPHRSENDRYLSIKFINGEAIRVGRFWNRDLYEELYDLFFPYH